MQYCPVASIVDETVTSLLEYIWSHRESKLTFKKIQATKEYQDLITKFQKWEAIIKESVLDMLDSVKNYEAQDYYLDESKGQIGYQDNDRISYTITYGYKTTFAYFAEFTKNKITE